MGEYKLSRLLKGARGYQKSNYRKHPVLLTALALVVGYLSLPVVFAVLRFAFFTFLTVAVVFLAVYFGWKYLFKTGNN